MVKILVSNLYSRILDLNDADVWKEIDRQASYLIPGFQFITTRGGWDGRYRLLKRDNFPTGLLERVINILKIRHIQFEVHREHDLIINENVPEICKENFIPRDYQIEAVEKACARDRGVIKISTGGGKTSIIAMIAARLNVKMVIYVIGIELLYQMKKTIEEIYPGTEVGVVGDGKCEIKDITICTIWSAASAFGEKATLFDNDATPDGKDKVLNRVAVCNMIQGAKAIIIDECQCVASQTVQFIYKNSKSSQQFYLFSATPFREDNADILIESVGGPIIYDMPASKLIKMGYLVPAEIHFLNIPTIYNVGKKYDEIYNNYIVNNDERNEILCKATKKLVDSGKKPLVLITRRKHGHIISEKLSDLRIANLDGSNKTEDRLEAIQMMKDGQLDVLIASKIFDQGIDIPQLDALVLAGSGKAAGRALQRLGRVIRPFPGKEKAIIVDTYDNAKYLRKHSDIRKDIYATEAEFKIRMPK